MHGYMVLLVPGLLQNSRMQFLHCGTSTKIFGGVVLELISELHVLNTIVCYLTCTTVLPRNGRVPDTKPHGIAIRRSLSCCAIHWSTSDLACVRITHNSQLLIRVGISLARIFLQQVFMQDFLYAKMMISPDVCMLSVGSPTTSKCPSLDG